MIVVWYLTLEFIDTVVDHIKHVKGDLLHTCKFILDNHKNNFGQYIPLQINCRYIIITFVDFVIANVGGIIVFSVYDLL